MAWTGDINPQWGDLVNTPGMVLNWGLAGIPYVACDIGGFTSQTQPDLLARWFQVGVFMPIMRVHSTKSATPHFPWLWGPAYAAAMKGALNLRYQLVPYHYSLAHHMRAPSGKLWMRSMVAEYPHDATSAPLTSQWFDGDILVAPVLKQDSTKQVYLPNGTWFTFSANGTGTGATVQGPTTVTGAAAIDEIPMYVRAGTVVPVGPVVQYTGALPGGAAARAGVHGQGRDVHPGGGRRRHDRVRGGRCGGTEDDADVGRGEEDALVGCGREWQ